MAYTDEWTLGNIVIMMKIKTGQRPEAILQNKEESLFNEWMIMIGFKKMK